MVMVFNATFNNISVIPWQEWINNQYMYSYIYLNSEWHFVHRHLFHSKNIFPLIFLTLYFKVNIYPFPLPYFASIFFAYLWSFRWPIYIVTLPRYFSFRLPHLNIPTRPPSDELDKNSQRTWLSENFSHWSGYSHFRFVLDFSYAFRIL